jgi:hypothetical protein
VLALKSEDSRARRLPHATRPRFRVARACLSLARMHLPRSALSQYVVRGQRPGCFASSLSRYGWTYLVATESESLEPNNYDVVSHYSCRVKLADIFVHALLLVNRVTHHRSTRYLLRSLRYSNSPDKATCFASWHNVFPITAKSIGRVLSLSICTITY